MECEVKVRRLSPAARLPQRATAGSAGADLCAVCPDGPVCVPAGGGALVGTGLAIELPGPEWVALVFARSGLSIKRGISLANAVGVIDADYRGEIKVGLVNRSDEDYLVEDGARVAQLVIMPVAAARFVEAETLGETLRGAGGFGSTGVKG